LYNIIKLLLYSITQRIYYGVIIFMGRRFRCLPEPDYRV